MISAKYQDEEIRATYANHARDVINNFYRAVDDILVRIEERVGSIASPSRKLNVEDVLYVFTSFIDHVNCLHRDAHHPIFLTDTRIGGILTGGLVYLELMKEVVRRYGDPAFRVNSFAVAVDKNAGAAVFEMNEFDKTMPRVVLADDLVLGGGTMKTAASAARKIYPSATIFHGSAVDSPADTDDIRVQDHRSHLAALFDSFSDAVLEKDLDRAQDLSHQADEYAERHKLELPGGWAVHRQKLRQLLADT